MRPTQFIHDVKAHALSAALLAAMEQDLFPELADAPKTTDEICRTRGWNEQVGRCVLDVLEANGYLAKVDGVLRLAEPALAVLDAYDDLRPWSKEMALTYQSAVDLGHVLETGDVTKTALSDFWAYKSGEKLGDLERQHIEEYSEIMERSQNSHARAVLDVLDLTHLHKVIDLGGGYGTFAQHAIERGPHLEMIVVDLPAVINEALSRSERSDHARIRFHACDALKDPLPEADAVIFNRVLHDWPDEQAAALLERARQTIGQSGTVIAAEHLDPEGAAVSPSSAATRLMLTLMGGKRRTPHEMRQLFSRAGLHVDQVIPTEHSLTTVVVSSPRK
jgi:demethylspheroidene O-methyltransferase